SAGMTNAAVTGPRVTARVAAATEVSWVMWMVPRARGSASTPLTSRSPTTPEPWSTTTNRASNALVSRPSADTARKVRTMGASNPTATAGRSRNWPRRSRRAIKAACTSVPQRSPRAGQEDVLQIGPSHVDRVDGRAGQAGSVEDGGQATAGLVHQELDGSRLHAHHPHALQTGDAGGQRRAPGRAHPHAVPPSERCDQLVHRPLGHHAAVVDDAHPVAHPGDLVHVMGGK